ncbi:MAG TPA: hypothetical protein VKS43_05465 [Burkholderiales bacterium]|nr:hypothetical protein [Burkholderiales bacterium]
MISVSLRSLLFYNFGIALVFTLIGSLSVYSLDLIKPNRANESHIFAKVARQAIEGEQAIEAVRAHALFYFDTARNIRRARVDDDVRTYYDVRILAFVVTGLFVVGGILALLLPLAREAHLGAGEK